MKNNINLNLSLFSLLFIILSIVSSVKSQKSTEPIITESTELPSSSISQSLKLINVGLNGLNDTLYWGTYRPHTYFGMKSRSTKPINTGLIWSTPTIENSFNRFNYKTEQGGDGIQSYKWIKHDGKNFGTQDIIDSYGHLNLTTSFIKNSGNKGGDWSIRISGSSNYTNINEIPLVSLIYYIHDESLTNKNGLTFNNKNNNNIQIDGKHPEIGRYTLHFSDLSKQSVSNCNEKQLKNTFKLVDSQPEICNWRYYGISNHHRESNWDIKKNIFDQETNQHISPSYQEWVKARQINTLKNLIPTLPNKINKNSNIIAVQRVLTVPFNIEISFISHEFHNEKELTEQQIQDIVKSILTGSNFDSTFSKFEKQFDDKFDKKFIVDRLRKHPSSIYDLTKQSLSGLLGGFGYWYGSGITKKNSVDNNIIKTKPVALFSATPSRPAFPRGFLWDEGFHQLLVSTFDIDLTIESLSHWLNIMDDNGWIPREQILGSEAASMVPEEFRLQLPNIANPPSIILAINKLLEMSQAFKDNIIYKANGVGSGKSNNQDLSILIDQSDFEKIQTFLIESLPRLELFYKYYWNTQSSSVLENAFRWRGRKVNHTLASGLDDYPRASVPSTSEVHVDLNSWVAFYAKSLSNLCKYLGAGDEKVLQYHKEFRAIQSIIESMHWDESEGLFHDFILHKNGTKEFIKTYGYLNYFPLLLGVLDSGSTKLDPLVSTLKDTRGIWSRFGIRSMSLKDKNFGTHENYWKGPIWININYLFLHSMKKFYPENPSFHECYITLRFNLLSNIGKIYTETGFLWEQYDPIDGTGKRNHPFNGWTSLVSLITSEQI